MNNKIEFAQRVANFMHSKQKDKSGHPYIEHVSRVAREVERLYPQDDVAIIAAWLHDTVEDTPLTLTAIRAEFGSEVADTVDALTRKPNQSLDAYTHLICRNLSALRVKLCDLHDNVNPDRMSELVPYQAMRLKSKYHLFLLALDSRIWGHVTYKDISMDQYFEIGRRIKEGNSNV